MTDAIYPLFLFVAVATVTPGGATMLATASGVRFGFARSIPLMLGIAMGLALLAAVAALGLGRLLLVQHPVNGLNNKLPRLS